MKAPIKQIILLLFISSVIQGWSQTNTDEIIWGTKTIVWSDFKGSPPNKSQYDARTYAHMEVQSNSNEDSLYVEISAKFIRSKSWAKKVRTKELLKHEQLHFDITEYHTRLFRKAILNYRFSSYKKLGNEIEKLFHKYYNKAKSMQVKYDRSTNHSRNKKKQKKWNEKVAQLLKKTAQYNMVKIGVYIGNLK